MPNVYLLTWCNRLSQLYGATLTFKTIRVGFPTAPIFVVESASIEPARSVFHEEAQKCGATFLQLAKHVELPNFIDQALSRQKIGPAVFLDGDLCFWESVEHWNPSGLLAGRFIPRYQCEFTGCLTYPRLHSSLLWVPDITRLHHGIQQIRARFPYFHPFAQYMYQLERRWHFFDTGAAIYNAVPEEMQSFSDKQLDCYDHLFSGTFADKVSQRLSPSSSAQYLRYHEVAKNDFRDLRGIWREQEEYFKSRHVND